MANKEAPNTLLSDGVLYIQDAAASGPISGFLTKPGPYGSDPLCSVYYDDVPVRNPDGSYNWNITGDGYFFGYTLGTSGQTGITGFQKVEAIVPLSSNTRIANPAPDAGPYKPVVASFNSTNFPDADTFMVTVRVPALFAQDADANTSPFEISYAVDVSINNGAWVTLGNEYIGGKCTQTYQKTTGPYQLPKTNPGSSYYDWKVRVRRVSQNILSIRTQNEIFVDTISIISSSLYASPNVVLIGTRIGSDQFNAIPTRAYDLAGMLVSVPAGYTPTQYGFASNANFTRQCDIEISNRHIGFTTQAAAQSEGVYAGMVVAGAGIPAGSTIVSVNTQGAGFFFTIDRDPTATNNNTAVTFTPTATTETVTAATYPNVWLGNFTENVWTDNPAWVFYDIMTNPVHGLGDLIDPGVVDKWTLYSIAQYCDTLVSDGAGGMEPRFTCNVNIQQPQDAYNVLLNLASTFRSMLYYANGAIHAAQNQDQAPVYAFNNASVVDGMFHYADTARDARATVAKVKWIDPQNNYRENVEYIEDIDGILRYGYQEKEMLAFACTSKGQAYRLGSWTLETERLLTETVTFQTSLEGLALRPGDNFAIYDNFRTNRNQAGRIMSWSPGRSLVNLDRSVALEPGVTYSLTAIVPKAQYDFTGSVTGSDQIPLIRNPQIESFEVTTAAISGTTALVIAGSFTSLYAGSPFVLAASGQSNALINAQFYTCLATAEVEAGKIEILGLQANTGVQFSIQTGYTIVDWPVNTGDNRAILPPSNLAIEGLTGLTDENVFYAAINLSWLDSPSANLGYYKVSGKEWDTAYEAFEPITTNQFNFTRGDTGQYLFKVCAVSVGGVESAFITGGFYIGPGDANPIGTLRPLSGVRLTENYDPLYFNASNLYTGYVGINPGFAWQMLYDTSNDLPIIDAQFVSGYRLTARNFADDTTYYTTDVSGVDHTTFQFTGNLLREWVGAPRGWKFKVQTIDIYGNVADGATLNVDNPPMRSPLGSGFVGYNGGVIYNVTPRAQYDVSGIYLWVDQNPAFVPTYSNYDFSSANLAGSASNIAPSTGVFYTWFAVGDTFAKEGNPIFGPVSGNAQAMFFNTFRDISADISGAFTYLTGMITDYGIISSGNDFLIITTVNGISGQILGSVPGSLNTALTVRIDNAILTTGSALASQINAVSARIQLTGQTISATVGTLSEALATTGGALATWITQLGAQTSGQNASVVIAANAFVTGDVNGIGGAAVATWGFKLDANGKVVSMLATSDSTYAAEYGTIVFGNAVLQSSTYTAGSAGWQIHPGGNAEFNNISARGAFTGGAGTALSILDGNKWLVGNPAGTRFQLTAGAGAGLMGAYNASNVDVLDIGVQDVGGGPAGFISVKDDNGTATVTILGDAGSINCETLDVDSTSNFDGDMTFPGTQKIKFTNGGNTVVKIDENNGLRLHGDSSHHVKIEAPFLDVQGRNGINGGIRYDGGTGYAIAFIWNGANVKVYVDGTVQGTIPNP